MEEKYVEKRIVRACNCDMSGMWKPSAILETMQETAGEHVERLGMTRAYFAQRGVGWVLTRLRVEMERLPEIDEEICIETYPTAPRHLFAPRSHVFYDKKGDKIGCASGLWGVMDLTQRKLVMDGEIFDRIPRNNGMEMATGLPSSVRTLSGEGQKKRILAQYGDLDTNGHVNNTKYMEWCINALDVGVMKDWYIKAFDVNYYAEILQGSAIETNLTRAGERFSFEGYEGEKRHFGIAGTLCRRE